MTSHICAAGLFQCYSKLYWFVAGPRSDTKPLLVYEESWIFTLLKTQHTREKLKKARALYLGANIITFERLDGWWHYECSSTPSLTLQIENACV